MVTSLASHELMWWDFTLCTTLEVSFFSKRFITTHICLFRDHLLCTKLRGKVVVRRLENICSEINLITPDGQVMKTQGLPLLAIVGLSYENHRFSHENCHFSWKLPLFTWKLPLFMKTGSFHRKLRHSLHPAHHETEEFYVQLFDL